MQAPRGAGQESVGPSAAWLGGCVALGAAGAAVAANHRWAARLSGSFPSATFAAWPWAFERLARRLFVPQMPFKQHFRQALGRGGSCSLACKPARKRGLCEESGRQPPPRLACVAQRIPMEKPSPALQLSSPCKAFCSRESRTQTPPRTWLQRGFLCKASSIIKTPVCQETHPLH